MSELGDKVRQQIQEGISKVYKAQVDILDQHLYRHGRQGNVEFRHNGREIHDRTGNLRNALYHPVFNVVGTGADGVAAVAQIPLQLRFFDMRHLGNWRIYNRQVWGIMYGEVLGKVARAYREQLTKDLRQQLMAAGNSLRK